MDQLLLGFMTIMEPMNFLAVFVGVLGGMIIGAMPGLTAPMGVALLIPFTYSMPPVPAIIMLVSLYCGATFGGSIAAILVHAPGTPAAAATTFDGYPLPQQGRAGAALTAAFSSWFVGAFIAVIVVTFLSPIVARFALDFGPPEFFAVYLLTFCAFIGMSKEPPFKTLAAMMTGFALAAVGTDPVTGTLRMTFGSVHLLNGFDFLIAVIGLFGIGEILLTMEEGLAFKGKSARINPKVVWQTWGELIRHWKLFLRSTAVGCWMGITPGGATPASFMSYGMARRMSKNPAEFGKGRIEGVVAPETAAHAAGTSALLPMLTLGIPGSPTTAILLGGMVIWGLTPGPRLFVEQSEFVWGLIGSFYVSNFFALVVNLAFIPVFIWMLRMPFTILAPMIFVLSVVGGYAATRDMHDVWLMLVFGVGAFFLRKLDYPVAPAVLAIVLGPITEPTLRQSLLLSSGDPTIFLTRPVAGPITVIAIILILLPLWKVIRDRMRGSKVETAGGA